MELYRSGNTDLYIPKSKLQESMKDAGILKHLSTDKFIAHCINEDFTRMGLGYNPERKEIFESLKKIRGNNQDLKIAMLDAHGSSILGKWYYSDGIFPDRVQSWISQNDGQYDLLVLHSCNPEGNIPTLRQSMALVPTITFSMQTTIQGSEFYLILPRKEIIPYTGRNAKQVFEELASSHRTGSAVNEYAAPGQISLCP
jgi:hypothetical protein